jgi:hypothetical protein
MRVRDMATLPRKSRSGEKSKWLMRQSIRQQKRKGVSGSRVVITEVNVGSSMGSLSSRVPQEHAPSIARSFLRASSPALYGE